MLFSLLIILSLWLFQTVFINGYYRNMKQRSVMDAAKEIETIYEQGTARSMGEAITQTTIGHDILVNIVAADGTVLYGNEPAGRGYADAISGFLGREAPGAMSEARAEKSFQELYEQVSQEKSGTLLRYYNDSFSRNMVVYGKIVQDAEGQEALLIITSQLQPMMETVKILSEQLIYVSIGILVIAFVISLLIARKVARPLEKITDKAVLLSQGDLDVRFEEGKGYYEEAAQLAHTLNYATDGLKQTEKLQAELIANVSHDLRTPLTMIKAYAEMIRDISGGNEEKRGEHLGVIIEECDHLSDFVEDLLDVSKMQAEMEQLQQTAFELDKTISASIARFEGICDKQGYTIHLDCPKNVRVVADESKIRQVLYNLIGNAIHYTGEDKQVYVRALDEGEQMRIEVRDTGSGVAPEEMEHIWQRYYRSKQQHQRSAAGSGIGLSIVHTILKRHGVDFGVDSPPGEGACFWFCLKKEQIGA